MFSALQLLGRLRSTVRDNNNNDDDDNNHNTIFTFNTKLYWY